MGSPGKLAAQIVLQDRKLMTSKRRSRRRMAIAQRAGFFP